jgi:hypothetical protein
MPHHVGARWSGAARYATAFALLVANGCTSGDATLLVVVSHGSGRAVIASPIDPRALRATASPQSAAGPLARSIARYYAAADSADSLDAAFQRERDALNRDARTLARADRRTPEYARDYDAFMSRVAIATRAREARDRARRRSASLRAQLGAHARDSSHRHADPVIRLRTALDSATRARGQEVKRARLRDRRATLDLEPGVWWIAVEYEGGLLSGTRRHEARGGARDTVRIGG